MPPDTSALDTLIERAHLLYNAYKALPVTPAGPKSAALHASSEATIAARAALMEFIHAPLDDTDQVAA